MESATEFSRSHACNGCAATARFLEFQNMMHLSQVLDFLCSPAFSPKESDGLFAAKSLSARHWEFGLKTIEANEPRTGLDWSEAVPR